MNELLIHVSGMCVRFFKIQSKSKIKIDVVDFCVCVCMFVFVTFCRVVYIDFFRKTLAFTRPFLFLRISYVEICR